MVNRKAVINAGVVENVILADDDFELPGRVLVTLPEGSIVAPGWTYDGEDFTPGVPVASVVPDRVTSRQFKLQLLAYPAIGEGETLLDDVEAWIATQSRAVQVAFANSGTFVRGEPMMQAGFAALGFDEAQVDAFFAAASGL
ncbi:MAG: hypothetical protein M9955_15715 [Rhizobiaceae bacterium]|nr:hypothetical protein [Rhizobiaceae bacterium]